MLELPEMWHSLRVSHPVLRFVRGQPYCFSHLSWRATLGDYQMVSVCGHQTYLLPLCIMMKNNECNGCPFPRCEIHKRHTENTRIKNSPVHKCCSDPYLHPSLIERASLKASLSKRNERPDCKRKRVRAPETGHNRRERCTRAQVALKLTLI